MTSARDKRQRRRSKARMWIEKMEAFRSGMKDTVIRLPEGVHFWALKEGTQYVDIVPYITGKGNPNVDGREGEEYFERTFFRYRQLGPQGSPYVCPSLTWGEPDPVLDFKRKATKKSDIDTALIDSLKPQQRQLWCIYDHAETDKGVQVSEISFHNFGKLLAERIAKSSEEEGWDLFYLTDLDGKTLRLTVNQESIGKSTYNKVVAIDFIDRKEPLPEHIINHGICLDDCLVHYSYDELRDIFYGAVDENEDADDEPPIPATPPPRQQTPRADKTPAGPPVASDFGIERGSKVRYNGFDTHVLKVTHEGRALILDSPSDGIIEDVSPSDVRLLTEEDRPEPKQEAPFDADPEPAKQGHPAEQAASSQDEPWDQDWPED